MKQVSELTPNMEELIRDNNYLCSMNFEDIGVSLILLYQGTDKAKYYLFDKLKLLFSGNDYRPSPMFNGMDTIESCIGLLGFLTLRQGDTDEEYFINYTPEQLEWIENSESCQQLRTYIYDFEGGENEYLQEAKDYFQSAYTN